jgi:hypothetical protein
MTPEQLARVREIFDAALEIPPDQRHREVRRLCPDDVEVLAQVERLLMATSAIPSPEPTEFAKALGDAALEVDAATEAPGYSVLQKLGRGGQAQRNFWDASIDRALRHVIAQ